MMSKKGSILILATAALATLLFPAVAECACDPWYNDLRRHWAEPYVRVLWEEDVTDGYTPSVNPNVAKYWPEEFSTRAQLATLLMKVFSLAPAYPDTPTYPDVPRNYRLFWNKPAWHLIEGAYSGGIMFVPRGFLFHPDNYISREDSVELLIRSLDLDEYAQSISLVEQDSILRRFWDSRNVSEARRPSMACAIRMGIIQGYEDGSLRPSLNLARGEAATVVARSCMIRMKARSDSFSPDGDGQGDVATFDLSYLKNRGIASWQAAIEDGQGRPVRYLGLPGTAGQPPSTLTWDGSRSDGHPATPGTYYYQALVTDNAGRQHVSVRRSISLARHSLTAKLQPTSCTDGRVLTVSARTEPGARLVSATFADGVCRYLSSNSSKTYWEASLAMGPFLPVGPQNVAVSASFDDAGRDVSLAFVRVLDMWLDPSVTPNPSTWGQTLTLVCRAPPSVLSARVWLFNASVELTRTEAQVWEGSSHVPWGVEPGQHPACFTVEAAGTSQDAVVILTVNGPDTSALSYVLTK